jgi:hypothetical protein
MEPRRSVRDAFEPSIRLASSEATAATRRRKLTKNSIGLIRDLQFVTN